MKVKHINMWLRGPYYTKQGKSVLKTNLENGKGIIDSYTMVVNPLIKKPYHESAFTDQQLLDVALMVNDYAKVDSLMYWLTATLPCVDYVPSHFDRVRNLFAKNGIQLRGLDHDCEGHSNANGWGDQGTRIAKLLAGGVSRLGVVPKVNYVVGLKGMRKQDYALHKAYNDLGIKVESTPQAYSQYNPSKKWTHNSLFRAGVFQKHINSELRKIRDLNVEYSYGFMTAFQNHPDGITGYDALQLAIGTYLTGINNTGKVRIWDSKITSVEQLKWLEKVKAVDFSKQNTPESIKKLQEYLNTKGFRLKVDGVLGPNTFNAIESVFGKYFIENKNMIPYLP